MESNSAIQNTNPFSKNFLTLIFGAIILIVISSLGTYMILSSKQKQPPVAQNITPTLIATIIQEKPTVVPSEKVDEMANWKTHIYKEIGLTFKAPSDLYIKGELANNNSFILFVQNWSFDEPYPGEKAYQLYGIYQWEPSFTEKDLEKERENLDLSSIKYTTIDEYKAIQGQIRGERNRYFTAFIKDSGRFSFFTGNPTKENEQKTNQILSTFKFLE